MTTLRQYLDAVGRAPTQPQDMFVWEILDAEIKLPFMLLPPDYRHEYQTNPHFHLAVDMLVGMLPSWVEGMALDAHRRRREREIYLRHAEATFAPFSMKEEALLSIRPDLLTTPPWSPLEDDSGDRRAAHQEAVEATEQARAAVDAEEGSEEPGATEG